ncbi:VRR-NUC domain-containing protein [Lipomyces kononenkoae]|uniref:VRR-NUC domain-containing protein n=1 Tax=Lipomyces kononenkoae TaxID=34357 RepID=A0ACC3T322_LIPKO
MSFRCADPHGECAEQRPVLCELRDENDIGQRLFKRQKCDEPDDDVIDAFDESYTLSTNSQTEEENEDSQEVEGRQWGTLYVDAFMSALNTVLENESYLFDENEHSVFEAFKNLEDDSKKLYVRLFLRRRNKWFRVNSFSYREILDIDGAWTRLVKSSIFASSLSSMPEVDIEEILSLFNVEELRDLAKQLNYKAFRGGNKNEMILALINQSEGQTCLDLSQNGLSLLYDGKGRRRSRLHKLLHESMEVLGPCVTLCKGPVAVFERAHLVFFRATDFNEKSLRQLILARISKRNFPEYMVFRSTEVFLHRRDLLDYENALEMQSQVDDIFDSGNITPKLQTLYDILEPVYERWQTCLSSAPFGHNEERDHYLIRFTAAWIYSRMMYKLAVVLSRLGRHREAHSIYTALLGQRIYRRGKRGDWYQRKALIENLYMCEDKMNVKEVRRWKLTSLATCEAGLQDPDTHVIYQYDLQKRIVRLERELRVLPKDKHVFFHLALKEAKRRTFYGTRVSDVEIGRKTVWLNLEGHECSVEEMCLSNYKAKGWNGYHTEGGIIRTIFAYVFWDILFLPVPYVFETEFQRAPLDLNTEAFYLSRASEINRRLADIDNNLAANFISQVYDREFERKTVCVGMDWNFDIQEVHDAAECIGGHALSAICKILCEEYGHRSSGMPDLFLWKPEQKKCLFSEVKSENDRLSDKQRVWIDVLLGAGVPVELCAGLEKKDDAK